MLSKPDASASDIDIKKRSESEETTHVYINESIDDGVFPEKDLESGKDNKSEEFSDTLSGIDPDDDKIDKIIKIVGPNADYYISSFYGLQNGEPDKDNRSSNGYGFYHALYRNVFPEWLHEMKKPFLAMHVITYLLLIFLSVNLLVAACLIPVALIVYLWHYIAKNFFALHFNRIYMEHVMQKITRNDISSDISLIKPLLAVLITVIYGFAILVIIVRAADAGYYDSAAGYIDSWVNSETFKAIEAILH